MESFPYRRLTLSVGYKSFPYILMRGGQAKVSLEPSAYLIPFSHIGVSFFDGVIPLGVLRELSFTPLSNLCPPALGSLAFPHNLSYQLKL